MPNTADKTRESDLFDIMHQRIVRHPTAGPDEFRKALDDMGINNIIDAHTLETKLIGSDDSGETEHNYVAKAEAINYRAYAYLSPPGHLQVWMEATITAPNPTLIAAARFSWKHFGQSTEQKNIHDRHARKLQAKHGSD